MSYLDIPAGRDLPHDFHVVIEIPADSAPVKYEVNKEAGVLFVDRFLGTAMHYPVNYGYVPATLADDGDPADVCVIAPFPVAPGSVIRCRPLGILEMEDEGGVDWKILAVPVTKLTPRYAKWTSLKDVPEDLLEQIRHFFEHYKDLEKGKWARIKDWHDVAEAEKRLLAAAEAYKAAK